MPFYGISWPFPRQNMPANLICKEENALEKKPVSWQKRGLFALVSNRPGVPGTEGEPFLPIHDEEDDPFSEDEDPE